MCASNPKTASQARYSWQCQNTRRQGLDSVETKRTSKRLERFRVQGLGLGFRSSGVFEVMVH